MSGGIFGIGAGEILFILVIVLLVVGPARLPQLARQWGRVVRFTGKISSTWNQMNAQIVRQLDEEAKAAQGSSRPDDASRASPAKPAPSPDYPVSNTIIPPTYGQPAPPPPQSPAPDDEPQPASAPAEHPGV